MVSQFIRSSFLKDTGENVGDSFSGMKKKRPAFFPAKRMALNMNGICKLTGFCWQIRHWVSRSDGSSVTSHSLTLKIKILLFGNMPKVYDLYESLSRMLDAIIMRRHYLPMAAVVAASFCYCKAASCSCPHPARTPRGPVGSPSRPRWTEWTLHWPRQPPSGAAL